MKKLLVGVAERTSLQQWSSKRHLTKFHFSNKKIQRDFEKVKSKKNRLYPFPTTSYKELLILERWGYFHFLPFPHFAFLLLGKMKERCFVSASFVRDRIIGTHFLVLVCTFQSIFPFKKPNQPNKKTPTT